MKFGSIPTSGGEAAAQAQGKTSTNPVMQALQRASQTTGVDFSYLVKTAQRESSLNPRAKAPTSSAAGLFQFIEQTWLATVKSHGAKHGYGAYANQIVRNANGRYSVPDAAARKQVLGLRYDATAASTMGAELTAGNAAYLKGRTGRNPSAGELYAAHFLGPAGAAQLMQAHDSRPGASAASMFPQAAAANRSIFYKQGRAATVAEVMANLTSKAGGVVTMPDAQPDAIEENLNGFLVARAQRVDANQALLDMMFGSDTGDKGLLFQTQLLSAFGPEQDEDRQDKGGLFG
ncbi:transglycosylase SLT domain-containing protein [Asticcacaulis machinosus]|uniref:Transglycosylase SLT domain-containing protein n=1 Tax=Asticcacaulis machinosus TaxID=2984211 RepID=A0ABT5HGG7_9CAUL|nr:transglycosylase SLT domain-containing protein [Asticcacaulis machinosus]MDC7675336.1 transglycosylase SLT domain-containing protein [Asticcacaulis machinosus]